LEEDERLMMGSKKSHSLASLGDKNKQLVSLKSHRMKSRRHKRMMA
jgi:hypothetical protein